MRYNFVIFSLFPWNSPSGSNIRDMSLELAKGHNILYVDVPLKRKEMWFMRDKPFVKEVLKRQQSHQRLLKISENLWHYIPDQILESVNSFSNNLLFDSLNYLNNLRFAKSIKAATREVGFDDYILLNDNDIYNGLLLKKLLQPAAYVYYLRDNLSAFSYWKRQASRLEPQLIRNSDLVITNSEYLADYARKFNSQSFYVGQGCEVSHYLQKPAQAEIDSVLKKIPKPIVGYIGALNSERLNVELIMNLAINSPDLSFVLIGPEDETFRASKLHQLKNVFFTGNQNFSDLPKFLYGFDVAINPQLLNEITIGNYPRKVDEYLAAGVPVVATKTHAMNPFKDHVYLASTDKEYTSLIKLAIRENSETRANERKQFASTHTWANNIAEVMNAIRKIDLKQKKIPQEMPSGA